MKESVCLLIGQKNNINKSHLVKLETGSKRTTLQKHLPAKFFSPASSENEIAFILTVHEMHTI